MRRAARNTPVNWPNGCAFAFSIIDDTDHATVKNVKPIYDLLASLNMRTTKTVWVFPTSDGAHYAGGQTLENEEYSRFILDLQSRGFEIALHGVRGESSTRDIIVNGFERFREVLGRNPAIHVNHAFNQDNLYWGLSRLSRIRRALHLYRGNPGNGEGASPRSQYFWGDLSQSCIRYVRGDVFDDINTLKSDPCMPYHDPTRPCVRAWFSASNGGRIEQFGRLLQEDNQERLAREHGLCIVYTHFGTPGFVNRTGKVSEDVGHALTLLSKRNGWFATVSEILDFLGGDEPSMLTWGARTVRLAQRLLHT